MIEKSRVDRTVFGSLMLGLSVFIAAMLFADIFNNRERPVLSLAYNLFDPRGGTA